MCPAPFYPYPVIPEMVLVGNPASEWPQSWIPDKSIRG
jgi:hypothetical protein